MSVESEILRIQSNIADAYAAVAEKGGEVPLSPKSAKLAAAVASIPAGDGGFPSGGIIIWSGAADAVPSGWALCDGQNGTPDLRDRFVLGAGNSYSVGAAGGEETHTLTIDEMPRHLHSIRWSNDAYNGSENIVRYLPKARSEGYTNSGYSGGSQPHNNMPPYYALCYIMKL